MPIDVGATPLAAAALRSHIRQALEASEPKTFTQLKAALKSLGVPTTGNRKVSAEAIREAVQAEIADGQAYAHPGEKFGREPPPNPLEVLNLAVREKVAGLGLEPVTESKLGKPPASAPAEVRQAFTDLLKALVAEKTLYRHGKNYGKHPPAASPWHQTETYKKPFEALVKAAKKVLDSGALPWDEIQIVLRKQLGVSNPTPLFDAQPVAPPVASEQAVLPPPAPPAPPARNLRTEIRKAYDHLCLFVEFRNKIIEIRRIYYETKKRIPDLSVQEFHQELEALNQEWLIELYTLNEVREAKDRHLAIERDGRLFYFLYWK